MKRPWLAIIAWCQAAALLSGAGAGLTADTPSEQPRTLRKPPDANRQAVQPRNIRKLYDARNRVIWFIPRSAPEVVTASAFYLYFGRGERGKLSPLRLKAIYYGDQPLEVRRYWANADGKQIISLPIGTWHMDDVIQVWEWLDEPLDSARQIHDLLTLAQAREAVIYIRGRGAIKKFNLSPEQKRALRDVIAAYQANGGSLNP